MSVSSECITASSFYCAECVHLLDRALNRILWSHPILLLLKRREDRLRLWAVDRGKALQNLENVFEEVQLLALRGVA